LLDPKNHIHTSSLINTSCHPIKKHQQVDETRFAFPKAMLSFLYYIISLKKTYYFISNYRLKYFTNLTSNWVALYCTLSSAQPMHTHRQHSTHTHRQEKENSDHICDHKPRGMQGETTSAISQDRISNKISMISMISRTCS